MAVRKSTRSSRQDRLRVGFTISDEIEFQSVGRLPLLGRVENPRLLKDPISMPQNVSASSTCVLVLGAACALSATNCRYKSTSPVCWLVSPSTPVHLVLALVPQLVQMNIEPSNSTERSAITDPDIVQDFHSMRRTSCISLRTRTAFL